MKLLSSAMMKLLKMMIYKKKQRILNLYNFVAIKSKRKKFLCCFSLDNFNDF